jgi:hypothetical protein
MDAGRVCSPRTKGLEDLDCIEVTPVKLALNMVIKRPLVVLGLKGVGYKIDDELLV